MTMTDNRRQQGKQYWPIRHASNNDNNYMDEFEYLKVKNDVLDHKA